HIEQKPESPSPASSDPSRSGQGGRGGRGGHESPNFLSLTKGKPHLRRGEIYGIYPTSPTIPTLDEAAADANGGSRLQHADAIDPACRLRPGNKWCDEQHKGDNGGALSELSAPQSCLHRRRH